MTVDVGYEVIDADSGAAIIAGLRAARAPWAVVLTDPHCPPSLVPDLLAAGNTFDADVVIATNGRPAYRLSTLVTRLVFSKQLRGISDPLSGSFAVRPGTVDLDRLRPAERHVLVELLVRARGHRVVELQYASADRTARSQRNGMKFARHLLTLWFEHGSARAIAFGLIGLSGFLPNLGVLQLLTMLGVHYITATIAATQVAILWNFTLLERFVYGDHGHRSVLRRLGRFLALNNVDLVLRVPALTLLIDHARLSVQMATVITLVAASAIRFVITDRLIFARRLGMAGATEAPRS